MISEVWRIGALLVLVCCSACTGGRPVAAVIPVGPTIDDFGVDHTMPSVIDVSNSSQIAVMEGGREHVLWTGEVGHTSAIGTMGTGDGSGYLHRKPGPVVKPVLESDVRSRINEPARRASVPLFCTECGQRTQCGSVTVCGSTNCDRPESCPQAYKPCEQSARATCGVLNGKFSCEAIGGKPDEGG